MSDLRRDHEGYEEWFNSFSDDLKEKVIQAIRNSSGASETVIVHLPQKLASELRNKGGGVNVGAPATIASDQAVTHAVWTMLLKPELIEAAR